ncbi:MAG TPA: D-alanyl-D-alanine endopeptidase [Steroidobacteraceae bacterium]|jgi:D-alanyl-D-alanine endopeptidase (penicillin-binding protein 7)|nr:D-alanyl-D-alanine endopeptidase [Steroidobacteraceae bacterium]
MRSVNRKTSPERTARRLPKLALATVFLGFLSFQVSAKSLSLKSLNAPKLKSSSVLIVDQSNSSVLYSRNSDVAAPIASITKLMTALVVLDAKQPLDEPIQITEADRDYPKGAYSRLTVGTILTRGDLMHLALMASENRAAHALGNNYPGGMPAIVAAMNAKAKALGMTSAHFVEPTGLSSQNVASPEDLSKLVIAASKNRTVREFSTDKNYAVRVHRHLVEFRNTDNLVANPAWNIIVQKTGYIAEAGKCLVMAAVIEGRSVVIVLLDSFGKYTRVADAQRIKTWMANSSNPRFQVSIR